MGKRVGVLAAGLAVALAAACDARLTSAGSERGLAIDAPRRAPEAGSPARESGGGPADARTCVAAVNPGGSVQTAVGALTAGATLDIAPGTYVGALSITKSNVTIRKAPCATGEVVIDGNSADYVISISGASGVTLEGLTITRAKNAAIRAVASDKGKVLSCRVTEWGLVVGQDSFLRSGIFIEDSSGWTIQRTTMNRGNHPGPQTASQYWNEDRTYNAYGIFIMGGSGGHTISQNTLWGAYQDPKGVIWSLTDFISQNDWSALDHAFDNSTISHNQFLGCYDEPIQLDGAVQNTIVENNYIDGMGARAAISISPSGVGPIHIRNNVIKSFGGEGNMAIKAGRPPNGGAKYVDCNLFWSKIGAGISDDGNGTSSNWHITNNKASIPSELIRVSGVVESSGNVSASFPEPNEKSQSACGQTVGPE